MNWISRLVIAVVYAVVVYLACLLIGIVLALLPVPGATIGAFIEKWALVISVLTFLYVLFVGYSTVPWRR